MNVAIEVKQELQCLKEIGTRISKKAMAYPEEHAAEMVDFYNNGMKISEIADYVVVVCR